MKIASILVCALMAVSLALAQVKLPPYLQGIGIDQRLNAQVPRDARFIDEQGSAVTLGDFLGYRPILLVPVYYSCPMLCNQTPHGVVAALRPLSLVPGRDFDVVVFSFNPAESANDARQARDRYTRMYSRKAGTAGWHFLTGTPDSIRAVTEAIGFHYRYDAATKMFMHQAGVMVLTPDGRVARYFYGVEFEPKDFKLGLIEASNRRIGSPTDKLLLFCYHYDPATGKYGAAVMNLLHAAAVATLIAMACMLAVFWKADRRRQRDGGRTP
jgi:protein SCO1/2